jgi:hypothetical protein
MRISRLLKRLRRWRSQAFRKRHSPPAFRTCRNAGNSVLTAKGTTSKGTRSNSCEVEFCIFYSLRLRTLRTKDVIGCILICSWFGSTRESRYGWLIFNLRYCFPKKKHLALRN